MVIWLLAAGLVTVQLRPIAGLLLDANRPWWSVCGQDLCLCRPIPVDPQCPLCLSGNTGAEDCAGVGIDPSRVPIRGDASDDVRVGTGHAGEGVLLAFMLLFAWRDAGTPAPRAGFRMTRDAVAVPDGAAREVPTPPPRA